MEDGESEKEERKEDEGSVKEERKEDEGSGKEERRLKIRVMVVTLVETEAWELTGGC